MVVVAWNEQGLTTFHRRCVPRGTAKRVTLSGCPISSALSPTEERFDNALALGLGLVSGVKNGLSVR
jgi:hypothetical protein